MSLLDALEHALAAQQAAAVLECDGSSFSGPQLLRLVSDGAQMCMMEPSTRLSGSAHLTAAASACRPLPPLGSWSRQPVMPPTHALARHSSWPYS